MKNTSDANGIESFWQELRTIGRRGFQVWRIVPSRAKAALCCAAGLMMLTSLTAICVPLLLGGLVDGVKRGTEEQQAPDVLFRTAAIFLAAIGGTVLLRELLHVVRRYLVESVCTRIDKHLSVRVVSHLMQVDLASLTHEKLGALHGRIFRSVDGFMRFLRVGFLDFFPAVLTGVLALLTAMFKQPWIGLAMLGVIPVSIWLTAWQLLSQKGIRLTLIRSREDLDGTVVEQLGGLDYVRVANTHAQEIRRVTRVAERRRATEIRHHVEMSLFGMGKALTEGFFHLVVLSLAVYLAVSGQVSFGDILTFSGLFLSVMTPLAEIHRVIDEGHEASLRVADLIDILSQPPDPSFKTATHRVPRLDDGKPIIAVENLRVEYRTAEKQRRIALRDVSLKIHRGETIGIAGRSGCGKSTLLKVLMRLVHPAAGHVYLKGLPLEDVSREALSKLIGYVGQSPFVFSGTLEENITYGYTGPLLPEDVCRAAQMACIHDEIMSMPEGYATRVAERGQNLSGGQKQRIALARVFLQDPPILLLDEATSALDNISVRCVQRAIDAVREDRTVLIVAHRLSTFADADRIFVFDNGEIVESGNFDNLVQQGGLFAELVSSAEKSASQEEAENASPVLVS